MHKICPCGNHRTVLYSTGIHADGRRPLCELSIRERGMEFKAVLAYESKK